MNAGSSVVELKTPELADFEKLIQKIEQGEPDAAGEFFDQFFLSASVIPKNELIQLAEGILQRTEKWKYKQPELYGMSLTAMSCADFMAERFDRSLQFANEAIQIYKERKDEQGMGMCNMYIGAAYHSLGNIDLAQNYLLSANHQLKDSKRDRVFHTIVSYHLAEIYSKLRQFDLSLKFYEDAIRTGDTTGQTSFIGGRLINGIAVIYQHQKKYALALDYFNRALAMAVEKKNQPVQARVLTDIANYYSEQGEYDLAIRNHEEALAIRKNAGLENAQITNLFHIGEIRIAKNETKEAGEVLNKALVLAEKMNVKLKMSQIHLLLFKIYREKNPAEAIRHHEAFHSLEEELHHEDAQKKMKNLQLVLEAEQTAAENETIRKQKAEIEKQNEELQKTIDELTRVKISRKAKALTIVAAVILLALEEVFLYLLEKYYLKESLLISFSAKAIVVLLLKPIENVIEKYLLHKVK